MTYDERLTKVVPHERQFRFQQLEFYAFIHFTVNTFTDREWGDGSESPRIFNPERLDPEQWVKAVKSAGMRELILTCKHHDGFCLWPSQYTRHTVAASPWKNGRGDVVKETAEACISVCGPDIRWCGNEAGHTRISGWSVVPERAKDSEIVSEKSQHCDDVKFRQRKVGAGDSDWGSRAILKDEDKLIWYPAEVNTSISPGWFWHACEDDKVRSLGELVHIYNNSVGGNATFLLNIPPTRDDLFHENDVRRLAELGEYIRNMFRTNLLEGAHLSCLHCFKGKYSLQPARRKLYHRGGA